MTDNPDISPAYQLGLRGRVEAVREKLATLQSDYLALRARVEMKPRNLQDRLQIEDAHDNIKRDLRHLWTGAEQALKEERPEVMQVMLFEAQDLTLPYIDFSKSPIELICKYGDTLDTIGLLLQGRPDKQKLLDELLMEAVGGDGLFMDIISYNPVAALLAAGANAHADGAGLLLTAINYELNFETIEALYKAGADIDAAITQAQERGYRDRVVNEVRAYRALLTGDDDKGSASLEDFQKAKQEILTRREEDKVKALARKQKANTP